jgi:hypothetical protein
MRVIGVHISRYGDGMSAEWRQVGQGHLPVYTVGRTYLLDLLHNELQSDLVRFSDDQMMRRAYQQLANLEKEFRESGVVYKCAPGQHDDLGISIAMLAWAARHPHLDWWMRHLYAELTPRKPRRAPFSSAAWT